MHIIEIEDISKNYDKVPALNHINLTVDEGSLFGLIGADGAGKTTLFRILTTLLTADAGKTRVLGLDVVDDYATIRKNVGYMPGRFSLYQDLTIGENLDFFASIFHTTVKDNMDLIAPIYDQIAPFVNRRAGKLSGGMKQKLALCCALVHKPKVLFLDEPTTGVDPVSRKEFWEMLDTLRAQGITIFASTPYMDEAVKCDHIALIDKGQILKVDTPQNIINDFGEPLWAAHSADMLSLLHALREYEGIGQCYTFGAEHHFTLKEIKPLQAFLSLKGIDDVVIRQVKPEIEDCYMALQQQLKKEDYERQ